MSEIKIYQEDKKELSNISFLRDTSSHVKIREINSYEFTKQISIILTKVSEQAGIKHPISGIYKSDIVNMILSRFKNLSLNEVEFAFKLERYGEYKDSKGLEDRTDHYHDFNTVYCSRILSKYKEWKRKTKMDHNISVVEKPKTATEKEKKYWINRGVTDCIKYYEEHNTIEEGKTYVYDILYDDGYLPTDNEYKKRVHKDALEVLKFEYETKKPTSLAEKKKFVSILSNLQEKNNGIVKVKCWEIALLEFFRKLTKDEDALTEFKNRYKNEK